MGWTSSMQKFKSKLEAACVLGCIDQSRVVVSNCDRDAVYIAHRDDDGEVSAIVVLIETRMRDGRVETAAKDMSEHAHPYYYGISRKVLAALTPPKSEDAKLWRSRCPKNKEV